MRQQIIFYYFLLALLGNLYSCKKWIDELPEYELVGENAIVDEKSALNALNGAYAFLQFDPLSSSVYQSSFSMDFAVNGAQLAGLLSGGQRNTFDRSLRYHAMEDSDVYLPTFYRQVYRIVNAANNVIYYTELIPETRIRPGTKKRILAEAHFLRGFAHFWALKYYGYFFDLNSPYGAVLRLEPTNLSNIVMPRSSVSDTYKSIISDYEYCIDHGISESPSVFQASSTIAKAFLMEALSMRQASGDSERVIQLADDILTSGEFKLEDSFADVFKPANDYLPNRELLFSRALNTAALTEILGRSNFFSYSVFNGAVGTGGIVYYVSDVTGEHYARLLEQDARHIVTWDTVSMMSGNPPVEVQGNTFLKVWRADGNCPSYFMRLAQVHLMKAEALLNTNAPVSQIVGVLNVFRARSGNDLFDVNDFGGAAGRFRLREKLVEEYVLELGIENASEWFSMVRNRDEGGARYLNKYNVHYSNDKTLALPIPYDEIVSNKGLLIQNP